MKQDRKVIGHILPWNAVGGTELATLRIAQAVQSEGFDSVMFCRADAPEVRRFFADHGFETASYDGLAFLPGRLTAFLRGTMRLAREFRRRRIDIVHCAELTAGDDAALAARLAGRRLVCHIRNRYDWLTRFQRLWLTLTHRIVFVSNHTRQNFGRAAKMFGSVADRVGVVVYDGFTLGASGVEAEDVIRTRVLEDLGIPASSTVVGMIARLAVQKDHLTLVKAAEIVVAARPDVRFLLVGGCGPEKNELQHGKQVLDRIAASSAASRILYTGFRPDVNRLLHALDVFVLCTHHEGLPLVLLEAMAHGKPVVATEVDGIPELVVEDRTGMLHRPQDAEHLAAQLLRVLNSADLAARLGASGRQFVQEQFSASRFADDMKRLYAELLRSSRKAGEN